jgi:CheY-like chemotaxis protein
MGASRNRLFIAAPAPVIRQLGGAFTADDNIDIVGCETWDDAVSRLEEREADLLVICYAFDEMRPFRLLQYLRQERPRSHLPTILVRALPVPLGKTQEEQIRESYQNLGVDQFYNLYDEKQREGAEVALSRFRDAVLARLRRTPEAFTSAARRSGSQRA